MESAWTRKSPDLSALVKNAVAIITGAGSGLGRALAIEAACHGMRLVLIDSSPSGLAITVASLPEGLVLRSDVVDVRSPDDLSAIAADLPEPPRLVFANAGVLSQMSIMEQSAQDVQRILDINVMGFLNTVQAFAPAMALSAIASRIVVTGSQGSFVAFPGLGAYCASKHAVLAIAESLAEEWAGSSVSMALAAPGGVATAIMGDAGSSIPDQLMSAEEAAMLTFAGALDGRFLISTHADLASLAAARAAEVARARTR